VGEGGGGGGSGALTCGVVWCGVVWCGVVWCGALGLLSDVGVGLPCTVMWGSEAQGVVRCVGDVLASGGAGCVVCDVSEVC
jgi:hypothetical protein